MLGDYRMPGNFTIEDIRKIRQLTGAGLTDIKKSLQETGDFDEALKAMQVKGLSKAAQREERSTQAGIIQSYIHDQRIGVLVEVQCETDFVARSEEFISFVKDLALQVAASNPTSLKAEESDKMSQPDSYLLSQEFIKDPKITINDLLQAQIAKLGENIVIARFVRFELGNK